MIKFLDSHDLIERPIAFEFFDELTNVVVSKEKLSHNIRSVYKWAQHLEFDVFVVGGHTEEAPSQKDMADYQVKFKQWEDISTAHDESKPSRFKILKYHKWKKEREHINYKSPWMPYHESIDSWSFYFIDEDDATYFKLTWC